MIGVIILAVLGLIYVGSCIWIVGPTDTGVLVVWGEPKEVWKSGIHFSPYTRLIGEVKRFSTKKMMLGYIVEKPITRKGVYYDQINRATRNPDKVLEELRSELRLKEKTEGEGLKEEGIKPKTDKRVVKRKTTFNEKIDEVRKLLRELKKEGYPCESIELERVGIAVYVSYPRGEGLMKTLPVLGTKKEEELKDYFQDFVVGCTREVIGTIPWRVVVENREYITKQINERFVETGSPFVTAGFHPANISIIITLVDLPAEFTKLLKAPQEEGLRAEAAEREAKKRAAETVGTIIEMMARIYGKEIEEIPGIIEQDPALRKEFVARCDDLIIRKLGMESGSYVDIRVQGAQGVERTILNALAAWLRMPKGEGNSEKAKEEKSAEEEETSNKEIKGNRPVESFWSKKPMEKLHKMKKKKK